MSKFKKYSVDSLYSSVKDVFKNISDSVVNAKNTIRKLFSG